MHSENFSEYEMKPLTPKPFLQEMSGREMMPSAITSMKMTKKTNSALSHNLNGKVLETPVIRDIITIIKREDYKRTKLHSNKISLPINRLD